MTTIAYRDGMLAADSLATSNGLRDDYCAKVWRVGPLMGAACGSRALCLKFQDWVRAGMVGSSPFEGKDDGNGLLVTPDHVICFANSGAWPVYADFYALGSGYQLAMGAMEVGASAEEAVLAAIKWDVSSGGDVTVLRLKTESGAP